MAAVALAWIGSPLDWIAIVATAASEESETRWIWVTVPTLTPAIRTGEPMCSSVWTVNVALSVYGEPWNGSEPPNTREQAARMTTGPTTADPALLIRRL